MRFPFRLAWNSTASYVGLLAASFGLALFISYIFGPQINDYAYDSMFRAYRPAKHVQPESVVLAIDELTLMDCEGIRGIRRPMARALRLLAPVKPKAVAIDVILADRNPVEDAALAEAFRATPNLVLSTELIDGGRIWEDPRPEFAASARLGHVSTLMDKDGVTRSILIDQHNARVRRRALALEAFLLSRGVDDAARIAHVYPVSGRPGECGDSGGRCHHPGTGGPARTQAPDARTLSARAIWPCRASP